MRLEAMSNDSGTKKGVEGLGKPKMEGFKGKSVKSLLPKLARDKPASVKKVAHVSAPRMEKIAPPRAGKIVKAGAFKAPKPPMPKKGKL